MTIFAIDPGPVESAYARMIGNSFDIGDKLPNNVLLKRLDKEPYIADRIVFEMIACYGMPVGAEVFDTCVWIGRFMQACGNTPTDRITRNQVKNHLCHSSKAKDSNIRQALIDRFGGKEKAIGKKASQGPLYSVSGDVWAALAVAVTWVDLNHPATLGEGSEG